MYRSLYEKCEGEARATGDLLVKECTEVIDEVEYLKKFERAWESFQSHYVSNEIYKKYDYHILALVLVYRIYWRVCSCTWIKFTLTSSNSSPHSPHKLLRLFI